MLEVKRGLALVEQHPQSAALIVTSEHGHLRILRSSLFRLLAANAN